MNHLAKMRQRFTLILAVLGAIDLLLIVYLLLPGSSTSARTALEQSLRDQEKTLNHQVAPLKGIDKQLAQTRVDVKNFYEQKVPSEFSQISQHLVKLMQETGVTSASGIHYVQENRSVRGDKGDLPDVQRINIDTTVTGEYAKVAKFINAMEQDKFVFIIDQISLTSQESGTISLQIKFETFLKAT
ncbi:MAG TPA: type 4a pilus biogenesis protein PilO [Candidatus Angelobacter sp.]|jgi:Tfp pilus assembly protein PilO|nr:type 4a pilus biogenesis protein PilO [Candidatus Angelobacter sp.]